MRTAEIGDLVERGKEKRGEIGEVADRFAATQTYAPRPRLRVFPSCSSCRRHGTRLKLRSNRRGASRERDLPRSCAVAVGRSVVQPRWNLETAARHGPRCVFSSFLELALRKSGAIRARFQHPRDRPRIRQTLRDAFAQRPRPSPPRASFAGQALAQPAARSRLFQTADWASVPSQSIIIISRSLVTNRAR